MQAYIHVNVRWFQHDWSFSAMALCPQSLEQVDPQTFDARPPANTEVPLRTAIEPELSGDASIQFASAGTLNKVWSSSGVSERSELISAKRTNVTV
jgi:hypothetical protein